jgi:lambda family phage portal protein
MASLLQRFAQRLGFVPAHEAAQRARQAANQAAMAVGHQANQHQRSLLAALTTNDVASWQADGLHINADTEAGLATVRARSRDAARNNPFARRFIGMVRRNVLGPRGVRLQSRLRTDRGLQINVNERLEVAYTDWSAQGACDVTGRYTRADIDRLVLRHVLVDGECFIRFRKGSGPHLIQLQLLPADVVPITHRADLAGGVRIRQGIEVDADGRVLGYWMRTDPNALEPLGSTRNLVRIPASEILHVMLPDEANQLRGVPWMQAALKAMHQSADFASAGLNKARESAKRGGFFKLHPDAAPSPEMADGKDASGTPFQTLQDGTWDQLPAGVEPVPFESDYPNIEYGQFIKDCLRNIASALEVSYISLGNDLSDVNYSSGQLGLGDERTLWLELQQWWVAHVTQPIYARWLEHALVAVPELQALSYARMAAYAAGARWQCHTWQPLDPLKTIEAQRSRLEAGITSPQRVMAENGDDPDEVLAELAEWEAKVTAAGLQMPEPAEPAAAKAGRLQLITGAQATGTE